MIDIYGKFPVLKFYSGYPLDIRINIRIIHIRSIYITAYRADLHQRSIPLGEGKEALDPELYAIKKGLLIV